MCFGTICVCSPETSGETKVCGGSTSMIRSLYNSHYVDFGFIFHLSRPVLRSR